MSSLWRGILRASSQKKSLFTIKTAPRSSKRLINTFCARQNKNVLQKPRNTFYWASPLVLASSALIASSQVDNKEEDSISEDEESVLMTWEEWIAPIAEKYTDPEEFAEQILIRIRNLKPEHYEPNFLQISALLISIAQTQFGNDPSVSKPSNSAHTTNTTNPPSEACSKALETLDLFFEIAEKVGLASHPEIVLEALRLETAIHHSRGDTLAVKESAIDSWKIYKIMEKLNRWNKRSLIERCSLSFLIASLCAVQGDLDGVEFYIEDSATFYRRMIKETNIHEKILVAAFGERIKLSLMSYYYLRDKKKPEAAEYYKVHAKELYELVREKCSKDLPVWKTIKAGTEHEYVTAVSKGEKVGMFV